MGEFEALGVLQEGKEFRRNSFRKSKPPNLFALLFNPQRLYHPKAFPSGNMPQLPHPHQSEPLLPARAHHGGERGGLLRIVQGRPGFAPCDLEQLVVAQEVADP